MGQAKIQIGYNSAVRPRSSKDRVTDFESGGCEFDPRRGRQPSAYKLRSIFVITPKPPVDNGVIIN